LKHNYYTFKASSDHTAFTFNSLSVDRLVLKKVEFVKISDRLYNLAFGDVMHNGDIDDIVVTNNSDTSKVLATVIQILLAFFEDYRNAAVYFRGSTPARTRMYQILLTREKVNWQNRFVVNGIVAGQMFPFVDDFRFEAFIIKLKNYEDKG
jgi:hypothetical protein